VASAGEIAASSLVARRQKDVDSSRGSRGLVSGGEERSEVRIGPFAKRLTSHVVTRIPVPQVGALAARRELAGQAGRATWGLRALSTPGKVVLSPEWEKAGLGATPPWEHSETKMDTVERPDLVPPALWAKLRGGSNPEEELIPW